ncbi:hypothetical protein SCHPADRAFT_993015 [Schizopora paradoxa]|uniref:Uncharacterized protein n=1 Tax=Schizopora paradoxa TaxID=27342 RepID=A0A0H2S4R2_9AGAM|nr:hypothetical protein SCHPADRAFT_993015 [Schizopora paradoxa]
MSSNNPSYEEELAALAFNDDALARLGPTGTQQPSTTNPLAANTTTTTTKVTNINDQFLSNVNNGLHSTRRFGTVPANVDSNGGVRYSFASRTGPQPVGQAQGVGLVANQRLAFEVARLQQQIREAYKKGVKDGEEEAHKKAMLDSERVRDDAYAKGFSDGEQSRFEAYGQGLSDGYYQKCVDVNRTVTHRRGCIEVDASLHGARPKPAQLGITPLVLQQNARPHSQAQISPDRLRPHRQSDEDHHGSAPNSASSEPSGRDTQRMQVPSHSPVKPSVVTVPSNTSSMYFEGRFPSASYSQNPAVLRRADDNTASGVYQSSTHRTF